MSEFTLNPKKTEKCLQYDPNTGEKKIVEIEICNQPYDDGPWGVIYCTLPNKHKGNCEDTEHEEYMEYLRNNPEEEKKALGF